MDKRSEPAVYADADERVDDALELRSFEHNNELAQQGKVFLFILSLQGSAAVAVEGVDPIKYVSASMRTYICRWSSSPRKYHIISGLDVMSTTYWYWLSDLTVCVGSQTPQPFNPYVRVHWLAM